MVIKGKEKYVFNYKKATNTTIIKEKTGNGINRTTRQGFVAVIFTTNGDEVRVDY
ncbi:MAG: hypothetical protein KAR00_03145 [Candidatus Pacebacteria bacterium]|nr:hypothetical protein [Candidatus Paceibacterota bacterium]